MDPLVQFYMNTVPQNQQVPDISNRPNAADFIRQSNPEVYNAYQRLNVSASQPSFFARNFGASRQGRGTPPDISGFFTDTSPAPRPVPSDFPYGPAMWVQMESDRLRSLGSPVPTSGINTGNLRYPGGIGTRRPTLQADNTLAFPPTRATSRLAPEDVSPVSAPAPVSVVPDVDFAQIIEGMRAPGGGGVQVDRSLFNLSETAEEREMLLRELQDIEARRTAGDIALRQGWGSVQSANLAAADKARAMAAQSGEQAAASWSQAAQQARDLAALRAQAAGQFEGRAGIDVDPTGGAADFIGFMESQAPAERRFAERQQEILGSDLDWMAAMAGSQGEAYAGDLRRQSNVLSFERAREHNLRVQDRINQERMMLAQMEQQAQSTNAQLAAQRDQFDPFTQLNNMVGAAAVMGNPGILAQQLGVSVPQAQQMVDNFLQGTQATVQAATPVR